MKKKIALVLIVLMVATTVVSAASKVDLGIVGYYSFKELEEKKFEDVSPAVRLQWNILDWVGLSADMLYLGEIGNVHFGTFIIDAVFRAPLGMFEPYIATGPAYLFGYTDDDFAVADNAFAYNLRGGLDFNITPHLAIGAELNFLVDDVKEFIEDFSAMSAAQKGDYMKAHSLIGLAFKYRW